MHLLSPHTSGTSSNQGGHNTSESFQIRAPCIVLPRGSGAIKDIDEKFGTSPGPSGFGSQFFLSSGSSTGKGRFGLEWPLSLLTITRETDKSFLQYDNAEEGDVFLLSCAEHLVSVLQPDCSRYEDDTTAPDYTIHPYRRRIERLLARIEHWINGAKGEIHEIRSLATTSPPCMGRTTPLYLRPRRPHHEERDSLCRIS
jgi:hypothetical protein